MNATLSSHAGFGVIVIVAAGRSPRLEMSSLFCCHDISPLSPHIAFSPPSMSRSFNTLDDICFLHSAHFLPNLFF